MIENVIKECEGLIYKLASKYSNNYPLEDLYQVGCLGVIKAYKKYNNESNAKFSTYAYKYILGEMIEYIKKDRNIVIGKEQYDIYKRYVSIKSLLYNKNGKDPSFSEVCLFMEIEESIMLRIIESVTFTKSIETYENVYEVLYTDEREKIDTSLLVSSALDGLTDYERKIIEYRYYCDCTQCEVASKLGISQANVYRQEKKILERIKRKVS